ncbi:MAG: glycosyltransferase family 4 protein [Deltaproteobacteria bacterium]|nr:glycosyltransferase family 4 protein [Deltaproteobacteria bacterium]
MNVSLSHIVIITAVYPPEPVVSARMAWDLAHFLADRGNKITVICPQPSRPANADYSRYENPEEPVVIHEDGIEVVRLPSFAAPDSRLLPRLYESWSFGRHACQYLAKNMQKPDVMYVNAWPLLAQAQIIWYAKKNRIPVILQIMDIYPEALFGKLPAMLRDIVSLPLLKLDTWIAQQARSVVVISDNMRRSYTESRRIPADRIATIPTWQDDALFEHVPDRIDVCRRYGIPNNLFTFLYLGNIGPVAGVDFLIRAFHEAAIDMAQLVIVGDGSAKADCVKLVDHLNTAHVHFVSDPDAANVALLQSMAHICLLPLKRWAGMSSIPSKLPAYLFSSKPVLATVDPESDTARLIQEAECGWVGVPEDLDWLASKMREVAAISVDELMIRGRNGQLFGLNNFSKSHGVERLAQLVLTAVTDRAKGFTEDKTCAN